MYNCITLPNNIREGNTLKRVYNGKNVFEEVPTLSFFPATTLKDLIMNSASPSKTNFVKSVSREKYTAHLAANSFKISIVGGFLIFSDRATIT